LTFLAKKTDGFSGYDIKKICATAHQLAWVQALKITSGEEEAKPPFEIQPKNFDDVNFCLAIKCLKNFLVSFTSKL
jgi:SpoVK/Ycf46/Vps4 family AAA+-type ATPase